MYSQWEEDGLIFKYIEKKSTGKYIDIGAGEPKRFSNTYMLYEMGWRGLLVEPNPLLTRELETVRPGDKLAKVAITDKNREEILYVDCRKDGVLEGSPVITYYKDSRATIGITVEGLTITSLLQRYPEFDDADFVSIDIEGTEKKLLADIDFHRYQFPLICIEWSLNNADRSPDWIQYLNGFYRLVERTTGNMLFLRK